MVCIHSLGMGFKVEIWDLVSIPTCKIVINVSHSTNQQHH